MQYWAKSNGVRFNGILKSSKIQYAKLIKNKIPSIIRGFIWLSIYLYESLPLVGKNLNSWYQSEADCTFVSYFFNLSNTIIPLHLEKILGLGLKFIPTPKGTTPDDIDKNLSRFERDIGNLFCLNWIL